MNIKEKYKTSAGFRMAVQDKLSKLARSGDLNIQRLYRQVAYSHFLMRLFYHNDTSWALKGGHALELRLQKSRATKDIDLALKDLKNFHGNKEDKNLALRDLIIDKAKMDIGDYFTFTVSEPVMELQNAPYGGTRFHIESLLNNKVFSKFLLDVGIGDIWIDPRDKIDLSNHLSDLGVVTSSVPMINIEQHLSEKIHAYTRPREGGFNSRVKDLVDMILLIRTEEVENQKLKVALQKTFGLRSSHPMPETLTAPPLEWEKPFSALCKECELDISLDDAFKELNAFMKTV